MKLAISTCWRPELEGEAFVDKALELGFDALELGYMVRDTQIAGFKRRVDEMPIGSVHAFCPVPLSAPSGHPELYSLAAPDAESRALARFHLTHTIECAADLGATAVVLHAGRVEFNTFWRPTLTSVALRNILQSVKGDTKAKKYAKALRRARKIRAARSPKCLEAFKREVEQLFPLLEKHHIVLGLENLPYLEAFPDETELLSLLEAFKGSPLKGWFDTGHDRVREMHGWLAGTAEEFRKDPERFVGVHINDVTDFTDDHFAPGMGKVDFAALKPILNAAPHVVFEPHPQVTTAQLRAGLAYFNQTCR